MSPVAVSKLATKQTAATIGLSMVATERHLWLNLVDVKEKEKSFLLDTLVLPSELFTMSEETTVGKVREVIVFRKYFPRLNL